MPLSFSTVSEQAKQRSTKKNRSSPMRTSIRKTGTKNEREAEELKESRLAHFPPLLLLLVQ